MTFLKCRREVHTTHMGVTQRIKYIKGDTTHTLEIFSSYFSRHFKILLDRLNIYIRYFIFKLKEKINIKLHKTQCSFYLNVS